MLAVGPFPIASAQQVKIDYPSNAPLVSVVLDNLSPFACVVTIGAEQSWLPPWTSNLFPLPRNTHQPVSVQAEVSSSEAFGELTATFFAATDTIPGGIYPVALTPVEGIGGTLQNESILATSYAPGSHVLFTVTAPVVVKSAAIVVIDPNSAVAGDYATLDYTGGGNLPGSMVETSLVGAGDRGDVAYSPGLALQASAAKPLSFTVTVGGLVTPKLGIIITYVLSNA